jgi:type I restriction enzyme M protein
MKNLQDFLKNIGFSLKDNTDNSYIKKYQNYEIVIDLDEANPKKSIINYGKEIKVGRKTTSNLSQSENLVVLECVDRLLKKGYEANSIELEKSWNLGHKGKGFLDVLVKDKQGKSLFMIECKNWGDDFNKEKNKMLKDGGQLLSYYRQEKSVKSLCLYASRFENGKIQYTNELIDTKNLKGENEEEIFDSWDNTFNTKGIFENGIRAYEFKNIGLTYEDLEDLEKSDGQTIFHQFAEILRKHIVSDKPNAFNKIFNLFICKIQDEDEKFNSIDDDLSFQFKASDNSESLFDRLNTLYKKGLENYIDIILPDINEKEFNDLIESRDDEKLKEQFRNLRYYRSSQEFAFKDVYNKETFEDNAEVAKEVVKLLQKFKIKYSKKHQHLGDFFELLLNTGFKQESGQYFTPIPLTRFICKSLPIKEIIDNKNNNKEINFLPYVIDYASGSGHFITEMMDEIDYYVKNTKDEDIKGGRKAISEFNSIKNSIKWASQYVYAIEKDYRLVKISKVSSFLNGDGDANVMSVDGLASFQNDKYKGVLHKNTGGQENNVFDILIANPPYSVSGFKNPLIKEHGNIANLEKHFELAKYLTDKSSEIECLFVERAKQLLKENSVAGIILPISILTNGGIYERTREIILEYFNIKAIVSLGNNAFMATGTKTIILFLEKKKSSFLDIRKTIDDFFKNYKDVICGGIKNAFSTYVKNTYEDIEFNDYISLIKNSPNEKAQASEFCKEYKDLSNKDIIKLEKEKLLYFINSYTQQVVVADSGEKAIEKEFYGYEFSNRRGHEGIHIYKNEEGKLQSKLYNDDVLELENKEKLNNYILKNFNNYNNLERDIEDVQTSEEHPLKDHIHYIRLSQLMSFDLKKFDKTINLNKKKDLKIESKWELVKLEGVCDVKKGTSITKKDVSSGNIPVVAGGINFAYYHNKANREYPVITVSASGANAGFINFWNQDIFASDCTTLKSTKDNLLNRYLYLFLKSEQNIIYLLKKGQTQPHVYPEDLKNFRMPLPPLEVQQKIVDKIGEVEKNEQEKSQRIKKSQDKIREICKIDGVKTKLSHLSQMTKRGKSPKYGFSKVQIIKSGQVRGLYDFDFSSKHYVSKDFILDERKLTRGDLLINSTGTGTAGRVNLFDLEGDFVVDSHITIVRLDKERILPKFALYQLWSLGFDNIEKMATGQSGQIEISKEIIENISISVPSVDKQKEIVEEIELLEQKIKSSQDYLNNVKNLKQNILDKHLK